MLEEEIQKLKGANQKELPAELTFKLYDTFGFPFELTKLILENQGFEASEEEFEKKLAEQVQRSKDSRTTISDMIKDEFIDEFLKNMGKQNLLDIYKILRKKARFYILPKVKEFQDMR